MSHIFKTLSRPMNVNVIITRCCIRRIFSGQSVRQLRSKTESPYILSLDSTQSCTCKLTGHSRPEFHGILSQVYHKRLHSSRVFPMVHKDKGEWQRISTNFGYGNRKGAFIALGAISFLFKKKETEDTIEVAIAKALMQESKGNIDHADRIMHGALLKALRNGNQQAVTYIYDQLANMLLRQGKFAEAEAAFKETLRRLITAGTERTDPAVIEISLKLAQIYSATRRISEAQTGFQWCINTTEERIKSYVAPSPSSSSTPQETIDTSENLPSPTETSSSEETAANPTDIKDLKALLGMCLEAYARFFAKYKKYDDAIELFTRALSISENDLMEDGQPHHETVTILNDLGTVYDLKGDYIKAKDSIRKSALLAQRLGSDEALPTIVCNLASVEAHTGNYAEAKRLYRKALKQAERQEDSTTVTIIKNKLAQLETDILLKKK